MYWSVILNFKTRAVLERNVSNVKEMKSETRERHYERARLARENPRFWGFVPREFVFSVIYVSL